MSHIRTIKPDFFFDEEISAIDPVDQLFFIGLWTLGDRSGRLEDRPMMIRAQIFPYRPEFDADACLSRLSKFVTRYTSDDGRKYIQINSFEKHQRPHHTERPSVIPPPKKVSSRLYHGELPEGREGKGKEGKGREVDTPAKNAAPTRGRPKFDVVTAEPEKPPTNQQAVFVQTFSEAYRAKAGQPFKADKSDYIIAQKLLKDYGPEVCIDKVKILGALCESKSAWFTRDGWSDFTIKKLSAMWNNILPEAKQLTPEEEFREELKRREELNELANRSIRRS